MIRNKEIPYHHCFPDFIALGRPRKARMVLN
jgi:hypothetical protein